MYSVTVSIYFQLDCIAAQESYKITHLVWIGEFTSVLSLLEIYCFYNYAIHAGEPVVPDKVTIY